MLRFSSKGIVSAAKESQEVKDERNGSGRYNDVQADEAALRAAQEVARREQEFHARYIAPQINLADAKRARPPMSWIVHEFGGDGHIVGVFGKPGSGKSYAMMDMAVCIATGSPWLGRATIQRPVLWIDEDGGRDVTERRLGEIGIGHDAPDGAPITALSYAGLNITTDDGIDILRRLIKHRRTPSIDGAPVLFIDTLADVCIGMKLVSPDDMIAPLQALRRISSETRAMIVFVHHANKLGQYLGATTISGKCDLLIGVNPKSATVVEFKSEKARHVGELRFAAKQLRSIIDGRDAFTLVNADTSAMDRNAKLADMRGSPRHVLNHLREHGASTIADMVDELNGIQAVRKAVLRLKDEGIIIATSKSTYALAAAAQDGDE